MMSWKRAAAHTKTRELRSRLARFIMCMYVHGKRVFVRELARVKRTAADAALVWILCKH